MAIVADGSAAWLPSFVVGHIEPGARVITGAWRGHNGRQDLGYAHERRNQRAGQRLPSSPRMGTRGLRVIRSSPSSWLPRRSRIGQARRWRPNGSSGHPGGQTRTWGPAQPGVQAGDQQGNISALLAASGHCPRSCARNVPWAGALWHGCGTDAGILGADPSSRLQGGWSPERFALPSTPQDGAWSGEICTQFTEVLHHISTCTCSSAGWHGPRINVLLRPTGARVGDLSLSPRSCTTSVDVTAVVDQSVDRHQVLASGRQQGGDQMTGAGKVAARMGRKALMWLPAVVLVAGTGVLLPLGTSAADASPMHARSTLTVATTGSDIGNCRVEALARRSVTPSPRPARTTPS